MKTFSAKPAEAKIKRLLSAGKVYLPTQFRAGYTTASSGRTESWWVPFLCKFLCKPHTPLVA